MERALAVDGSVDSAGRIMITPGAPTPRNIPPGAPTPRRIPPGAPSPGTPPGAPPPRKSRRVLDDEAGVLAGLVVVALIFGALIGPQFFRAANLELMARQTVIVCVAALGMTMVIVSGGIDLSVGSVVALSTVVTALLLNRHAGPAAAAVGAVAAGGLCGIANGLLVTRLRVVPFIVTLGTMLLVRGAAKGLADERRIEAPISWLNGLLRTARDGSGFLVPAGIWVSVALALAVAAVLRYTRFGRHLF